MIDQLDNLLNGFKNGSIIDYETISGLSEIFNIWKKESDPQKEVLIKKRLLIIVSQIPKTREGFDVICSVWKRINTWSCSAARGVIQPEKLDQKSIFINQLILDKYIEILSTIPCTKEGFESLSQYSVHIEDGFEKLPDIVGPYHDKTMEMLPLVLPDENSFLSLSCLLYDNNIKNNSRAMELIDQRAVEIINKEFPKIDDFWIVNMHFWHYRLPGNSNSKGLILEKMRQIFRNTPKTIEGFEKLGSFYKLAQFHGEIWNLLSQEMIECLILILPQIQDLKTIIRYFRFVKNDWRSAPFDMLLKKESEILSTISDFEELMTCRRIGGTVQAMEPMQERIAELLKEVTKNNFPDSLKKVLQWNLREHERKLFLETIERLTTA